MRLYFLNKVAYNLHIFLGHWELFDLTALVEGKVKEVYMVERNVVKGTCCARFATTNKAFQCEYIACIEVARFLILKSILYFFVHVNDNLVFRIVENLVETVDEMHKACYLFVVHCNVTTCFISHVNIVLLVYKALYCSAHRDHIIVRMG